MDDNHKKKIPERIKINHGKSGRCGHCAFLNQNTGSEYEWVCLILKNWICETDCCEIQMKEYGETRKAVASQIKWKKDPDEILNICKTCPYRNL